MLNDVVTCAEDDWLEAISELTSESIDDECAGHLLERCLSHLENIEMAAELDQLTGLHALCGTIFTLVKDQGYKFVLGSDHGRGLLAWLGDVKAYVEDPAASGVAERLLIFLPEENHETWLQRLKQNGPEPCEQEQPAEQQSDQSVILSDNQQVSDMVSPDEDYLLMEEPEISDLQAGDKPQNNLIETDLSSAEAEDGGILGVLSEEIAAVEPQLSSLLEVIFLAGDDSNLAVAQIGSYKEVVDRVITASEALGLNGLRDVCVFIETNLDCMAEIEPQQRQQLKRIFEDWPSLVLAYLHSPGDDRSCLRLIEHLQKATWPYPMTDENGRELLESLTSYCIDETNLDIESRQKMALPEDVALVISADVNPELLDAFFQESPTHAANFSSRMERITAGDEIVENIEAAQRLTHTLKGSANLIGVNGVANLAHHLEDILEYLAKRQIAPPTPLAYTLQEAADCLETMIDALQGVDVEPQESLRILQDVLSWANYADQGAISEDSELNDVPVTEPEETTEADAAPLSPDRRTDEHDRRQATQEAITGTDILQVPVSSVDTMFRLVGETSIAMGRIQEHLKRLITLGLQLREQDSVIQQRRLEIENLVNVRNFAGLQQRMQQVSGSQEVFDSLELDQYDELYSTTHHFIESVADSRELSTRIQGDFSTLEGLFAEQQIINRELQDRVMALRMVPVAKVVSRLKRSVRQACRATGKQAELSIDGADLLLDSEVLDKLVDPLMHVLRNAIDHGIEEAEQRLTQGKPASGNLTVAFSREGNHMVVRCTDDGRGLDYERIREKAEAKGLLDAHKTIDRNELARLILVPGFSTRDKATQISGRGIGMDVVHNSVRELKGSLDIGEVDGSGCLITMHLPITLITSHTVLVKAGNEHYAIPTNYLAQILPPQSGSFSRLGDELTFNQENTVYPVKLLTELLGSAPLTDEEVNISSVVFLARAHTGLVAVPVDQVVNSHELVVKSLGRFVTEIHGVAGVSTLGDGSVVAVLDLPELLHQADSSTELAKPMLPAQRAPEQVEKAYVLIVDDSLSVRNSLAGLVTDAGYEALLARDGLEAINLLRKHTPKVVLADLEMPNMNGLELTSYIRANQEFRTLPVAMITSRTQQKHRQQAEAAGVNAYLTKPYSEDDLLGTINQLVNGE